ncbi:hypothetical protein O0I10_004934 [Lichtheimia ornata]|uniref:Uncharacterized protein n=1 Tax=Lichtheimia ornata TaxID=688661 RepID=A0AAD7V6K5_9FUNG|nr:uncharacterized protein O0I10_004934 [Lichtheimia ornata]KAJ8659220.1 hypothetical protein O0I10_004934 [Lichtheimia ornata]
MVIDIANQPQTGENGLSVEDASDPSTRLLQDEEDCDDDDNDDDSSRDDDEDCDEDEDGISSEYVVDASKNDEDCDNENERPSPSATNASSKPAAQVPTSPFVTDSEDGARPTVTAYTTITSEIFSPSADMLHASSSIESDVIESNGHTKARVSISLLGVLPFALVVWLP